MKEDVCSPEVSVVNGERQGECRMVLWVESLMEKVVVGGADKWLIFPDFSNLENV